MRGIPFQERKVVVGREALVEFFLATPGNNDLAVGICK